MPDSDSSKKSKVQDKTDTGVSHSGSASVVKEREGPKSEAAIISEIVERSDALDEKAESEVKEHIKEARLARPAPEIGPDLEDHGVKSPEKEASAVLEKGPSGQLPITQKEYEDAQRMKVSALTDDKKNVFGVNSVIALAMLVGRILKMAHNHTTGKITKLVFRKDGE